MTNIFLNILEISIGMTPIIILIIFFNPLLGRVYKSVLKYWLWLGISIRLMLPVSVKMNFFSSIFPAEKNMFTHANINLDGNLANYTGLSNSGFNIQEAAALIYFSVALIFITFKLANYIIFRKNIKARCVKAPVKITETVCQVAKKHGMDFKKRRVDICICKIIPGPMVFGILKPTLLLPGNNYDEAKLKMLLSHEIVHIKRYDTSYKLFLTLVCAVHWFNPIVHIMVQKAFRDLEISCDSKALQGSSTEDKKQYSLMIIDIASLNYKDKLPALFTSFDGGAGILESRIKNILSANVKKEGHLILVFVLLIAIISGNSVQIHNKSEFPVMSAVTADIELPVSSSEDVHVDTNIIEKNNEDYNKANGIMPIPGNTKQEQAAKSFSNTDNSAEIVIVDLNRLNDEEDLADSSSE